MNETNHIFEKYVFFSARKEQETLNTVLDILLSLPLANLRFEYEDRPDQEFVHFNDRNIKIIYNIPDPQKITLMSGRFTEGGSYELKGGTFSISIFSEEYNYEVIDAIRKLLTPVLPICIFRNPYIWGVDLYLPYSREILFNTRQFAVRTTKMEEPEIDIFRRDNGVIFKLRFHLNENLQNLDLDQGIRYIYEIVQDLVESLKRGAYEGLEVLHAYCQDKKKFRQIETRTKVGQRIKSLVSSR